MAAHKSEFGGRVLGSPVVFVIDSDGRSRESLRLFLEAAGHAVEVFSTAAEFRRLRDRRRPGCVLLDLRLLDINGLELQAELAADEFPPPVVFHTALGSMPLAVEAMKAGAFHFVEKPCDGPMLLNIVQAALTHAVGNRSNGDRQNSAFVHDVENRLKRLTLREREVLNLIVSATPNRIIAQQLGLSLRTIENHRARILSKMCVESTVKLLRLVANIGDCAHPESVAT